MPEQDKRQQAAQQQRQSGPDKGEKTAQQTAAEKEQARLEELQTDEVDFPNTDQTIHYEDVPASVVGTPTEGPAAVEAGTESDEARRVREEREAEAEAEADEDEPEKT